MDTLNTQLDEKNGGPLMNPYYTVRFLNSHFTLLGEVSRPGNFSIPGEHVNLFEGLGMAGDMTFFGRRDNILIIRINNGKREFQRLDLTKPDVFKSPYYFLQQGDIVYVEASRKKLAANDQVTARNVSLAATIISTLAIIYSIFKK
jgi:polysaccharide export outer membrane protein